MRLLIFGGAGMAGHVLHQYFREKPEHEVWVTERAGSLTPHKIVLDVRQPGDVESALKRVDPDVVINAVGLLNQTAEDHLKDAIYVNSLFPHMLADYGQQIGFKLVHISTDCVFSGRTGNYREDDRRDGDTAYARTKALGEVIDASNITIRTSIIGPEKKADGIGLFEWFSRQRGAVPGYRSVFWNGVTTLELARATEWILQHHLTGLVHLSAPEKVSKYDLLQLIQQVFQKRDVTLVPTDQYVSDKSLINTRSDFDFRVHTYRDMITEMKNWMEAHHSEY